MYVTIALLTATFISDEEEVIKSSQVKVKLIAQDTRRFLLERGFGKLEYD